MRSSLTAVGLAASIALAGAPALASAQTGAPGAAQKGDRELGQHLSSECVACHQISGRVAGGVPAIVGWPDDQFVAVMLSYKNKDRDNQVMRTIAGRLSMEEIEALAAYFGELPQ